MGRKRRRMTRRTPTTEEILLNLWKSYRTAKMPDWKKYWWERYAAVAGIPTTQPAPAPERVYKPRVARPKQPRVREREIPWSPQAAEQRRLENERIERELREQNAPTPTPAPPVTLTIPSRKVDKALVNAAPASAAVAVWSAEELAAVKRNLHS